MTSRLNPDLETREGQKCNMGAQEKQVGSGSQENCKAKMTETYRDQAVGREGKSSPRRERLRVGYRMKNAWSTEGCWESRPASDLTC